MSTPTERTQLLRKVVPTPVLTEPSLDPKPAVVDPRDLSKSTRTGILAGIWIATFLAALNTTLVATLLTSISSTFSSSHSSSLLGTSYLLAHAAFTPLYGRLSNALGRRGANQLALFLLFLGTLGCSLAPNMKWLVAARFIAGCGGGGSSTTASIVTSDLYSLRRRSLTQGVATLFSGLGTGLGGPVGGWVGGRCGWRWAFGGQLPFFLLSYFFTQRYLHYTPPSLSSTPPSLRHTLTRLDYPGTLLLLLSISSTLFSLTSQYSNDLPLSSLLVWAPAAVAGAGGIGFIAIELKVAVEPVLDPRLLRMRIPVLVALSSFLVSMSNFAVIYFFPLWFEMVAGTSSAEAGLHLLPGSVWLSLGSLFAGYYLHKFGKYRTLSHLSGLLSFLSSLLLVRLSPQSGWTTKWLSIIPLGLGSSIVLQTTFISLLLSVPPSQIATSTGFVQLFRGLGQVTGVAGASAVFQSLLSRELVSRIHGSHAYSIIKEIRHNSHSISNLSPALQKTVREAFGVALGRVFLCAAGGLGLAVVVRMGVSFLLFLSLLFR
ncbi:major facilitator superfamily domain-containing protein [Leucosporidium creatinivorum]|uniref:Major facilitator superfamily domain-containing protein n=1 Tax=Leucosporidium creatinivorum TaxID=106004 RepID=A0A1Y2D2B6_9BASI|nr:major facilitator superfamily domain-containing protein [Leucosporidium creatinivorum]